MTEGRDSTSARTRRARRLASKRENVKRIAVRLVLDEGLESATVEAISAAADITPRTFYNYFATKEDALAMERSWTGEEAATLLRARPCDEPVWDSLREVLTEIAASLEDKREHAQIYHELYHRHPELLSAGRADTTEELSIPLTEVVGERVGVSTDTDVRPTAIVQAALSIMQAALRFHWSSPGSAPIEEVLAEGFAAPGLR